MKKFIPRNKPSDKLFNRRLLAYVGLVFSVFWFLMVFLTDAWKSDTFEVAKIVAYLGVPASIAGLGFWQYLSAAKRSDEKEQDDDRRLPRMDGPESS